RHRTADGRELRPARGVRHRRGPGRIAVGPDVGRAGALPGEQTMNDVRKGQRIFGIDLGTTYSAVALREPGRPARVLAGPAGELVPSLVGWDPERRAWLVGRETEELRQRDPAQVASSVKRFIGRAFRDVAAAAAREAVYRVAPGDGSDVLHDVRIDLGEGGE